MKKTLTFILAILIGMAGFSQSVEEQKKKITSIKKDSNYIYAEVTTTSQQQAIDLATDLLYHNINEWTAKNKKFAGAAKVITVNTNYDVEKITMPRANMFRAFMYVKKSDIIPADNAQVNDNQNAAAAGNSPKPATLAPVAKVELSEVAKELLKIENTGQLSKTLKELKNSGKISEYNNLKGLKNKDLTEYIMVVFNKDGIVEAILSEGKNRINLKTGSLDQMSNYKGRGAIGVKEKK